MILFADGFDHYGAAGTGNANMTALGLYAVATGAGPSTAHPRTGTHSYCFSASAASLRRDFGANKNDIGFAFSVYFDGVIPDTFTALGSIVSAGINFCLFLQSLANGKLQLVGPTGAVLATSANVCFVSFTHHTIEVVAHRDDVAGTCKIYVDGTEVINFTGDTNRNDANPEWRYFQITTNNSHGVPTYIDDLVVWDINGSAPNTLTYQGNIRCKTLFPDADDAQSDWAKNAGAVAYDRINQAAPDGDTTYLQAGNVGDKTRVGFQSVGFVTTVLGVSAYYNAKKTDAFASTVRQNVVSNGDVANGAANALTLAYGDYHDVFAVDPDTAAPWTQAAIDALLMEYERTA